MDSISDILNRDEVLRSIEELATVVGENFETLTSVAIIWDTEDGPMHHRCYGTYNEMLGLLARAQFVVVKDSIGRTRRLGEDDSGS